MTGADNKEDRVMGNDYKNILRFWRAVETFNLPDVPVSSKKRQYTDVAAGGNLPWEPGVLPAPREGKQWRHTLYLHVVRKQDVVQLLARLSDSKEFREPIVGDTCLAALVVNHMGQPVERTYSPAAFLYGIKIIREKLDHEELPVLLRKAQEEYQKRAQLLQERSGGEEGGRPEVHMVDWRFLRKELNVLREAAEGELKSHTDLRYISEEVDEATIADAPFLNSYYVKDLNSLINSTEDPGLPLKTFLSQEIDISARTNLLQQRVLLENLHPRHQSPARWPSNPDPGLYSAQQAALNITLSGLREGTGLLGINGPPGTGKTTLLREIVADVVAGRARRLLEEGAAKLFEGKWNALEGSMGYCATNRRVFDNDGIVVASNNNAAVENISRELPVINSIHRESYGQADYFSPIASIIQDAPCWGMVSAALGRSNNRKAFMKKFWFSTDHNFRKLLKQECYDPHAIRGYEKEYERVAGELTERLGAYERFQGMAGEYHDLLCRMVLGDSDRAGFEGSSDGDDAWEKLAGLADRLVQEFGLAPESLPDKGFLKLSVGDIHRLTPYSSGKTNVLRGEIFLQSLKLTELAIRLNARQFAANLNTFVNMSPYKSVAGLDEEVAETLWNTFFFCIPVVSVTLASFQPQFANMGRGSVGWVLVDEAGQATLPSVCGAIWRARRCVVIGDTRQIPPVVTVPAGLGRLLQKQYGVGEEWSPLRHSVQFLADRVTRYGTYIDGGGPVDGGRNGALEGGTVDSGGYGAAGGGGDGWTGIPLRAHRRCSEPMFTISNAIAYNGQMVKVTQDRTSDLPTGGSGWIDVLPMTVNGHAVTEELQVAEDLIQRLVGFDGKIFVISPFRNVVEACAGRFKKLYNVDCGTIHTFQGKEAEVVILVLGTDTGAVEARNWVAESPNMLNVAVTRARDKLYVIGNRKAWGQHRYFDYLTRVLEKKDHESGRLF